MSLNIDTQALVELSDAELQEVLDNSGKGKPAIYKAPIREILALADGCNISVAVAWKDVNPAAESRQTVIAGFTAAVKRNEDATARKLKMRANADDEKVTIVCGK